MSENPYRPPRSDLFYSIDVRSDLNRALLKKKLNRIAIVSVFPIVVIMMVFAVSVIVSGVNLGFGVVTTSYLFSHAIAVSLFAVCVYVSIRWYFGWLLSNGALKLSIFSVLCASVWYIVYKIGLIISLFVVRKNDLIDCLNLAVVFDIKSFIQICVYLLIILVWAGFRIRVR